jgi:hypothetical protein
MELIEKRLKILITLSIIIMTIAGLVAYVYGADPPMVAQTFRDIASISFSNSELGNIEEGQTL